MSSQQHRQPNSRAVLCQAHSLLVILPTIMAATLISGRRIFETLDRRRRYRSDCSGGCARNLPRNYDNLLGHLAALIYVRNCVPLESFRKTRRDSNPEIFGVLCSVFPASYRGRARLVGSGYFSVVHVVCGSSPGPFRHPPPRGRICRHGWLDSSAVVRWPILTAVWHRGALLLLPARIHFSRMVMLWDRVFGV